MTTAILQEIVTEITSDIDWTSIAVIRAFAAIAFMPIFWTCLSRLEYYTRALTTIFGFGNRYRAVYIFALIIWSGSAFRDHLVRTAMESQPPSRLMSSSPLLSKLLDLFGYQLAGVGAVFVVTSMFKLGIVGTYLGDHFGILQASRVESFPFNILNDPMYVGSTMVFTGCSLLWKSWIGLACTLWIYIWYQVAIFFEGPFTAMIYKRAAAAAAAAKQNGATTKKTTKHD